MSFFWWLSYRKPAKRMLGVVCWAAELRVLPFPLLPPVLTPSSTPRLRVRFQQRPQEPQRCPLPALPSPAARTSRPKSAQSTCAHHRPPSPTPKWKSTRNPASTSSLPTRLRRQVPSG
uniref:(northern house mosquito) hypothetical protein n=1 Tax=Culex pipiens TaxID=7175 RepID=A0A8D8KKC4_CULPI